MKKRIIAIIFAMVMIFGITGCSDEGDDRIIGESSRSGEYYMFHTFYEESYLCFLDELDEDEFEIVHMNVDEDQFYVIYRQKKH